MQLVTLTLLAFVLAFLVVSTAADDTNKIDYTNCRSIYEVKSVTSDECEKDAHKCVFKRGSKPTIKITFVPNKDVPTLKAEVRSKLSGGTFSSFALDDDDACTAGHLPCPLIAGKEYTYSQSVSIADTYPIIDDVQVNWVLNDDFANKKEREVCIVFKAKIVA